MWLVRKSGKLTFLPRTLDAHGATDARQKELMVDVDRVVAVGLERTALDGAVRPLPGVKKWQTDSTTAPGAAGLLKGHKFVPA